MAFKGGLKERLTQEGTWGGCGDILYTFLREEKHEVEKK